MKKQNLKKTENPNKNNLNEIVAQIPEETETAKKL